MHLVDFSGAQKHRTGLILSGQTGTVSADQDRWLHPAPFSLPKQAPACWAEAPHCGAQSDVWSASTGRPEMAVRRPASYPDAAKRFNVRLRLTATRWGGVPPSGTKTHLADLTATQGFNSGPVDYRATSPSDRAGKLPGRMGRPEPTPHPPDRAGEIPKARGSTRSRGWGLTERTLQ